jgi:hypothetical protein
VRAVFHRTEHEANRLPYIQPPIPVSYERLPVNRVEMATDGSQ